MPRKQAAKTASPRAAVLNRLENLFTEVGNGITTESPVESRSLTGWTWECDAQGVYTSVSPEVRSLLGYPAADFLGQPVTQFGLADQGGRILDEAIRSGFPVDTTLPYATHSGDMIFAQVRIDLLTAEDDKTATWRGIVQIIPAPPEQKPTSTARAEPAERRSTPKQPGIPTTTRKARSTPAVALSPDPISLPPEPKGLPASPPPASSPLLAAKEPFFSFLGNGVSLADDDNLPALKPLSATGQDSLEQKRTTSTSSSPTSPAALATPLYLQDGSVGLLEFVSGEDRLWSIDDQLLVEQVADQLSQALYNAQLFQSEQRRAGELNAVLELSRIVNQQLDQEEIFASVQRAIGRLMPTESFFINLIDYEADEAITTYFVDKGVRQPAARFPLTRGLTGYLIRSLTPIIVQDLENERLPFNRIHFSEEHVRSLIAVPLIFNQRVIGILSTQSYRQGAFTKDDLDLLQGFADHIAIAVENARLFSQVELSLTETESLYRASAELNNAYSYDEVLAILRRHTILDHPSASNISISLFDHPWSEASPPEWFIPIARWSSEEYQPQASKQVPVGPWTTALKFLNPRAVTIIEDAATDERLDQSARAEYAGNLQAKSIIFAPLNVTGNWIGHLVAVYRDRTSISANDIRRLTAIIGQAAVTIENVRLFEQTQNALGRTETLYQVSRNVLAHSTVVDLMESVADEIAKTLEADRVLMLGLDINARQVTQFVLCGPGAQLSAISPFDHYMDGLTGWVIHEQKPAFSPKGQPDPRESPAVTQMRLDTDTGSVIVVPLKYRTNIIGTITAIRRNSQLDFSPPDIDLLTAMGAQAAVAITNIQLLEESRRRTSQLEIAAEIARETSGTLNLDALLNRTVFLICDRFSFYYTAIVLLDENEEYAVIRAATGEAGKELIRSGYRLKVGSKSIIGSVTSTGKPIIVNDAAHDPIFQPHALLPETQSEIGIPLIMSGRVIGALDVQSDKPFTFRTDEVGVLQTLADQIAIAVNNAKLYQEQSETAERLRELDYLKSQFLANMSHELRTPLNSIIGFSRVILKGIDGPTTDLQQQDLNAIYNSGQHLLNMINNILDLSKIEAGKMEIQLEEVRLQDLFQSVMATSAGLVRDRPVEIRCQIPETLPSVKADSLKIRQVMINLLSNAAKFTEQGTVTIEAAVQANPDNLPEVIIKVKDTGIGIDLENQKKLFEPFSQVDSSPTRKTGGTGLGLSICRRLIEMHNGRIGVESDEGQGSTFYFTLPLAHQEPTGSAANPGSRTSQVILSIDENKQVINLYERYLRNHGYQVIALTDPTQAVAHAKVLKPLAITLDVNMAGQDGWQVLKDLHADPEIANIPIIICTIFDEQERGINLGAADYLIKPIIEDDLVKALARFVVH